MKTLSIFQIVLLVVFGLLAVIGLIMFATYKGNSSKYANLSPVVIWGTVDQDLFGKLSAAFRDDKTVKLTYVEKKPGAFDTDLIQALADGKGPDAILVPQDRILRYANKITPIPYTSVSERDFRNTFVQESELFVLPQGALAYPLMIDPLVMYWNRDIFQTAGFSNPPKYWDEFLLLPRSLTVVDNARNIVRSAVALGTFGNITNAKDIFSALLLQSGTPIAVRSSGGYSAAFSSPNNQAFSASAAQSALRFYTDFADPVKSVYSWNSGLPNSRDAFAAGDLAVYFGFASELNLIRDKNPNLNFDAVTFPQIRDSKSKISFGRLYGIAPLKSSPNITNTYRIIGLLIDPVKLGDWSKASGLPPVRRDLLAKRPADPFQATFFDSALIARGWLDPDANATAAIFRTMIESIITGRANYADAVETAEKATVALLADFTASQ